MRYQRPRGTQDILPDQIAEWRRVEEAFRDVCRRFCYQEIRTPIFEDTDLFIRSVGEETDIVSKEMYTFQDRGGRSLTLRPEGTAPVVRAFLENNLQGADRERIVKLFYIAPVFRYDRPQAGRYRQHHQAGVEALGSQAPALDAEVIHLALTFYAAVGIKEVRVLLNSVGCPVCRPAYVQLLRSWLAARASRLCADCVRRHETNPLRVLDCKEPECATLVGQAPKMLDALCPECAEHFAGVKAHLDLLSIGYEIEPRIVRGLDYYTKTAFEFVSTGLGAQDAIGGGGRYDGLVEQCGGPPTPGVGLGMGVERVLLVRQGLGLAVQPPAPWVCVVAMDDEAWPDAFRLVRELREGRFAADADHRRRSANAQMRWAARTGCMFAVFVGSAFLRGRDVSASGDWSVNIKDLRTGQDYLNLPRSQLEDWLVASGADGR